MELEVSEVVNQKGFNPVIVDFENGKISDGLESELECKMFMSDKNKRRLAAFTNSMTYIGDVDPAEDLQYCFLVVRKKNCNKVRLINSDRVILKPVFESTKKKPVNNAVEEKVTNADLNKQFGSKKAKRITEQRDRLKLDIENVKEQLEKTVAEIKIDDYFLNASEVVENDSMYTPPINRNATTLDEVYDLDNLVPKHILDALETEVNSILASEDLDNLGLFKFCKKNIEDLKPHASSTSILTKCKIYVYINYLLKFLTTPAKSMSKKFVLCKTSRDVDSHILNHFSVMSGNTRTRPMSMRDKTICYILVLAVIASNYNLNLETIALDIKVGTRKLQEMARILALTVNGPRNVLLKLPLPVPIMSNLKRKRK